MAKEMRKGKYLLKNLLIFGIGGVLPKILAFIMVPIYTNYLSTADYGIADIIIITAELLIPIFTLTIYDAVLRFGLDKNYDGKQVLSAGLRILFFGTVIVSLIVFIIGIVNIIPISKLYLVVLVCMFFLGGGNNILTRFCRTIDKVKIITISGVANSVVMFGANVLFLVVFHWGLEGYLFAQLLGNFVSILICFFGARLHKYLTLKTTKGLLSKMVAFSFPMIFSAIAWWINNASDKYIVLWMCGISVSGVFALSSKIPSLLAIFQTVFNQAWSISAIKEFDRDDKDGFIRNVFSAMALIMALVASILIIMNLPFAELLYSKEFYSAWMFVPPLIIAIVFNSLSLHLDGLFLAVNDTKSISISTVIGAIVNTVCNIVLIYFFGAYGAAIATMIGFFVGFMIRLIKIRKYFNVGLASLRDFLVWVLLLGQMTLAYFGWRLIFVQPVITILIILFYIKDFKQVIFLIKNKKKDVAIQDKSEQTNNE